MLPNEKHLYNLLRQAENRLADFKKAGDIPEILECAISEIFKTSRCVLVRIKPLENRDVSHDNYEGIVCVKPLPPVKRRLSEEEIEDRQEIPHKSWYSID
jgi:hypothetical protein